nr:RecName: Full=Conotoxin Im11.11; AltName: Full=Conopeptide im008; Flags: Precursor [Conus imperialis]AME17666.1 conopeptide im008 [Conus imperialis]
MFRLTSVGCILLVIAFLNLVGLTNACTSEGYSCSSDSNCCKNVCCWNVCESHCRHPGKRTRLQGFFKHRR